VASLAAAPSAAAALTAPYPEPSVSPFARWNIVVVVSAVRTSSHDRLGYLDLMSATMPATIALAALVLFIVS
jgi:hypothetical protein